MTTQLTDDELDAIFRRYGTSRLDGFICAVREVLGIAADRAKQAAYTNLMSDSVTIAPPPAAQAPQSLLEAVKVGALEVVTGYGEPS